MRRRWVAVGAAVAALAMFVPACASQAGRDDSASRVPPASSDAPASTMPPRSTIAAAGSVKGFSLKPFRVTAVSGSVAELCLWLAATPEDRERGLMGVTDESLGGADGMVFQFERPTFGSFWMRNTPLPLSIAFFDEDGRFVEADDMEPCGDTADCPTYGPRDTYQYAVEVPRGGLGTRGVAEGAVLRPGGSGCTNKQP